MEPCCAAFVTKVCVHRHPGNLLATPDGELAYLDFGMALHALNLRRFRLWVLGSELHARAPALWRMSVLSLLSCPDRWPHGACRLTP